MSESSKFESSKEYLAKLASKVPSSSRRDFLKKGVKFSTGLAAATVAGDALSDNLPPNIPIWTKSLGTGVVSTPYGIPSKFEKNVIRRTVPWLTADKISSISMSPIQELKGIITPNGLVFERYHAGAININPDEHRLMIHGLVDNPLIFTMDDLMQFPSESVINFLECPANGGMEWRGPQMEALQFTHGMISCCEWTGVRLSTLLAEVGVQTKGKWILAEGADGSGMNHAELTESILEESGYTEFWKNSKTSFFMSFVVNLTTVSTIFHNIVFFRFKKK